MSGPIAATTSDATAAQAVTGTACAVDVVFQSAQGLRGLDTGRLATEIVQRAANDPGRIAAMTEALHQHLTPVQQGELARELPLAQLTNSSPVTIASASASSEARLQTRIGGSVWGTRVAGIEAQLTRESQLQRGVDPSYANTLAASANSFDKGTVSFAKGAYRQATSPELVTTESRNPLFVDTLSQRNAELTIRNLSGRIDANAAEVRRLGAETAALSIQRGVQGVVGSTPELDRKIEANSARVVDLVLDNVGLTAQRTKALNDGRLQGSRAENGNMYRAVAEGADASRSPVIFINGVNTDVNRSALQAMELSAKFRAPVDHVVNVSSMDKMISVGRDVLNDKRADLNVTDQRLQQLMTGNRPAAATAANAILDQLLNSSGKVKMVGYSQGAAIGNEALRMVTDYLKNTRDMSVEDRAAMLGRVEFLGIGPAAGERHISRTFAGDRNNPAVRDIPELRSVDYRTVSASNDPIPQLLNVSNPDGSRTNSASVVRSLQAVSALTSPTGILPHLSYFSSYEATDPGSNYNPAVSQVLHQWYAGADIPKNTLLPNMAGR